MEDGTPFVVEVQLRWGDMDALAHVNNAAIVTLLEEGRVRFLAALASGQPPVGFSLVAARHEIDYVLPIAYSLEPVRLVMSVVRIGTSSFTIAARIMVSGAEAVRATTVVVAIDPATGRSVALPDFGREALGRHVIR